MFGCYTEAGYTWELQINKLHVTPVMTIIQNRSIHRTLDYEMVRSKTMPDHTVLIGRRLIDGTGSMPIENPVILIQGSKIAAVGREGDIEIPQTENVEMLNYRDKILLPGLIDCHVHLCLSQGAGEHSDHDPGPLAQRRIQKG